MFAFLSPRFGNKSWLITLFLPSAIVSSVWNNLTRELSSIKFNCKRSELWEDDCLTIASNTESFLANGCNRSSYINVLSRMKQASWAVWPFRVFYFPPPKKISVRSSVANRLPIVLASSCAAANDETSQKWLMLQRGWIKLFWGR